jgi:hypothetical protein
MERLRQIAWSQFLCQRRMTDWKEADLKGEGNQPGLVHIKSKVLLTTSLPFGIVSSSAATRVNTVINDGRSISVRHTGAPL